MALHGMGAHFLDGARGASAVKEINKGQRGLERCEVGHEAQVHHLLQGAMITKYRQGLPCQNAIGDMEHRRKELARTEIHAGYT